MAEAPSLYAESLEKLDKELTCPICLKHFEEPKVLQCCHYYCLECIVQMRARTRGKDYFQCPECRKEIRLPGDDPESLPTAFFVNRMKEVFSMMQKAQGKVELTCENCHRTTTPVEAFCRNCALFICQHCEEAHRTMRVFSDHVVVPLDDLRQNTAAHLPVKEEAQIRCKEHGGEEMKLYCYDCKQLICRDCIVIDHKGHEYNFVNKAAVQCRASLKESVAPLRETKENISQVLKEVELMKSKLDTNSTTVARDIDRSVDGLISLLQKHKEQLHCEAEQLVGEKQEHLLALKKNVKLATAEIQSLLDFVDHKSQQTSDQEVLGLQKQITDRADEVVQKYGNPKKQFGPPDVPCLQVHFNADYGRKVKQMISISDLGLLGEEVITLPGSRKLTLKKANIVEEKVDVIVNAANSRLQHEDGVAQAINSASHGEVQKYSDCHISRKGQVPVGQGVWTNAGGALKCKFVFHAVGPDSSHTATECERLLTQVVNLALLRADKANHTSIAIPAISSGIFGVNKDLVAHCIIDAILNFSFTKAPPVLSDIRIVIIDNSTYSCFVQYFAQKQTTLQLKKLYES